MMFHIGCCGYTVAKTKYHSSFDIVELQQVFYQPPSMRVLHSWRAGAPEGFRFILKAWQLITHDPMSPTYNKLKEPVPDFKRLNYGHFRPTPEVRRAWETTAKAAEILGSDIIVFQCPPTFKPTDENIENMKKFFKSAKRAGRTFVWEPRGHWKDDEIKALCTELDLVHCADPFRQEPLHGRIKYLRLQGKSGFRYTYSDEELGEVIKMYEAQEEDVYVLFNNASMFNNALRMTELLAG